MKWNDREGPELGVLGIGAARTPVAGVALEARSVARRRSLGIPPSRISVTALVARSFATSLALSASFVLALLLSGCGDSPDDVQDLRTARFEVSVTRAVPYGVGRVESDPAGIELLLDLYEPTGDGLPDSLPAMIFVHGGGFTGGSRTQGALPEMCTALASRGYLCASIDYRLRDPTPVVSEEFAPFFEYAARSRMITAAVEDTGLAHTWIVAHTAADPDRIAVGGGSAGAITAAHHAWTRDDAGLAPLPVRAVVLWAGSLLFTPAMDLAAGDAPFINIHSIDDPVVPYLVTDRLVIRATEVGVPFEHYAVPGARHGIPILREGPAPDETYFDRIIEFLATHLG